MNRPADRAVPLLRRGVVSAGQLGIGGRDDRRAGKSGTVLAGRDGPLLRAGSSGIVPRLVANLFLASRMSRISEGLQAPPERAGQCVGRQNKRFGRPL